MIGDADGFADTLRREKPAIMVLGYDQELPDTETKMTVAEMGIEVIVMPWFPGKGDLSSSCA